MQGQDTEEETEPPSQKIKISATLETQSPLD